MAARTAELLATACESVSAADALSAMRCGAFSSSGSVDSTAGGPGRPDSVRRRRTLESEDSSYDSDTENPPDGSSTTTSAVGTPCGTTATTIGGSRQHEDVSRTVSETLGAEFAEYVTAGPQYASRLEFAVKLGYTEAQVQQALRRLGPQPAQNELLAELVRLGAREQQQHQSSGGGTTAVAAVLAGVEGGGTTRTGDHHSTTDDPLRPIVIDGSNVAMSHGNKEVFSCRGIQLAVEWFRARGHTDISVFVPSWRKEASRAETPIKDQEILLQLEKERLLFFTPSRNVGGKRMVCYEDRYILKMAAQTDGVVVSNDNYRDLVAESLDFKRVVEERLLMYTFVNDRFMPPDDPLGRHGPSLDAFLRKSGPVPPPEGPPSCPYGKKCTYGNKCKYYHPERGNLPQKSVTERLAEQARLQLQEVKARSSIKSRDSSPGGELLKTKSLPPGATEAMLPKKKMPLSRTKSSVPSSSLLGADLLEADGGGHLSVAKRLSDPDSGLGAFSLPKGSPVLSPGGASGAGDDAIGSGNLHRKLQRQLTLNPAYDPRLYQLRAAASASPGLIAPPPPAVSLAEAVRASSQESLQPPHRALGRLASDSGLMAGGWAPLAATQHPEVTRIASAPDSTRRSQQAAAMQRLSSTSDTRLDAFPLAGAAPPPVPAGPYPSYPGLSPHATGWGGLPMGRPPPPHLEVNPAPFDTASPRYRLYYHLSSIFPEEQVRAAMDLCPEETNPQKVCAAILAMFPKG